MATAQEAVRRLTIQSTVQGVEQSTAQLEKLADAQNDVAVASSKSEKATLSLDSRFASIERRYVAQVRAQQDYEKTQRQVNAAVAQNPALQERANIVLAAAKQRLDQVTGGANDNAKAVGLARYELINLSRQAQDVAVSLAGGQSPLTVLFQQGSQIADVFTSSQGTVAGFFKQVGSWLGGFLTAGRVAFGGVTALILGSVAALDSLLSSQQKVNFSLLGAGRASGATAGSVNSAAQQGSSAFGLSVSEARDFAAVLASTGKVANDNILPIVKMGHDISIAFGTDAAGAAKLLSEAFSDPVKGADELNQRLGFLDAATRQNIQNLTAQNNLYGAQQALLAGMRGSLEGFADTQSLSAKGWTAIGNAISNAWTGLGQFLSSMTGLGRSVEDQLERARQKLAALENQATDFSSGFGITTGGTPEQIAKQRAEVERLAAAYENITSAAARAQAAQQSFVQASTVRAFTPIIAQQEDLNNQLQVMQRLFDSIANDDAAGERLKSIGITFGQLAAAIDVVRGRLSTLKPEFETTLGQLQLANRAITAFSPGAKADVARQESLQSTSNSNFTPEQRKTLAEQAYQNALKQSSVALGEQARSRELSSNQAIQSQQLEIDLIGKTIGQQAELRANLQARQQLEQQASQNRTAFDDAEYARLQKINAELGKRAQAAAIAAVNDNISFGRQTALLTPEDVQIAQQLKGLYPDVAAGLNSVQAGGIRANQALSAISSTVSTTLTTGFADILDGTKSVSQGFADMSKAIVRALEEATIKMLIVQPIMRGFQSLFGGAGIFSLFGFSGGGYVDPGSSSNPLPGLTSADYGPGYAAGGFTGPGGKYQPAGIVHAGEYVFDAVSTSRIGVRNLDAMRSMLRGYDDGGFVTNPSLSGAVKRGPWGQQDNSAPSFTYAPNIDARGADAAAVARLASVMAKDKRDFEKNVQSVMIKYRANNPGANR